ncbi:MAG: hypothetical protein C0404_08960 [Verrucomicrobia bacterium]|nr:hypothetical protein [Verrucomicrobiota bacterium]
MTKLSILATLAPLLFFLVSLSPARAGDDPEIGGTPLSKIVTQLKSDNRGLQLRAAKALNEAPVEVRERVIPSVVPLLKSERENDRFVAAQVLGEYGPKARVAVSELLPLLEGTQFERNRAAAAKALGLILKDAAASDEVEKVTQALMKCFTDKYSDVRREAVTACGMIGPAAKSCIPLLSDRFNDTEWLKDAECYLVRRAAAWTTGRMGKLGAVHVDKLISMMHGNAPVDTEFVDAIGEIGPVQDNLVPNIVDKMEKTLYGGYQGATGPQMANYVKHCQDVLAKFGGKSEKSVDLQLRLLTAEQVEREPARAVQTLNALAAIGPAAAKAVATIESNCLKSKNADVVKAAEAALAKIKAK